VQRLFAERKKTWMTIKRDDEFEALPGEVDPIIAAASPLLVCVLELTANGSRERARAVSEVLEVVERIRAALAPKIVVISLMDGSRFW
jgi:hypothetical protein